MNKVIHSLLVTIAILAILGVVCLIVCIVARFIGDWASILIPAVLLWGFIYISMVRDKVDGELAGRSKWGCEDDSELNEYED